MNTDNYWVLLLACFCSHFGLFTRVYNESSVKAASIHLSPYKDDLRSLNYILEILPRLEVKINA
eukprot:m.141238 g.141238  ORF g.141238 m.141238 type:complete len:64 (+) comp15974_c1_seq5:243-434(+)